MSNTEGKLRDLYQRLVQDGYRVELLGKDGKLKYVAVPYGDRIVVIDYCAPYFNVGEIGAEFGATRYCFGCFHAFKVYTTGIIEKYVHEIVPNPELDLGGIEKYQELCALDNSDPDFLERAGNLFEEYMYTKNPDEYRRVYEQWKQDQCLAILSNTMSESTL